MSSALKPTRSFVLLMFGVCQIIQRVHLTMTGAGQFNGGYSDPITVALFCI